MKHSFESVLESFVSRYENHVDARRTTNDDTPNEEFNFVVNGPSLACYENLITEAMDLYWRSKSKDGLGDWHFFRTGKIEDA